MKKAIAFILVIVLCASLCACSGSKPNGTYTMYIGEYKYATYSFSGSGNKVTAKYITSGETKVATWEMEDNTVILRFEGGSYDDFTYDPETDTLVFWDLTTLTKE